MKYTIEETKTVVAKEIEILPCPFCESENVKPVHISGNYGYTSSKDYVECENCGACGPIVNDSNCGKHIEEALIYWNMRAK